MAPRRSERAFQIGIAVILLLTLCFSALAFSYLEQPGADDDPWTYREVADRDPASALDDIGAELAGRRSRFVSIVPPQIRTESHQVTFDLRGKPLVVRVVPEPTDPQRGRLIWDTPGGPRAICRGVRPGGFRVLETADGWILKLEVVRMDRDGNPTDIEATKTVRKPRAD